MWIHEGWTTYLETLFVEFQYGRADGLKYTSGLIPHVLNRTPIITERGVNGDPPQDQYFKGALMLATLRSVIDNDTKWFALIKAFYQRFKYQNIMTEDVIAWWNLNTHLNLTAFFNQYLRHTAIPCLELQFDAATHRPLQMASRRTSLRNAHQSRRSSPVANHPPHYGLAGTAQHAHP